MILGTGIDLVRIERIASALERWPRRFEQRVFSDRERADCGRRGSPPVHYSGRFAVKEAMMKAVGTGWRRGIRWTEIECLNDSSGRPRVETRGAMQALLEQRGVRTIHVSLSHDGEYAVAHVVLEGRSRPDTGGKTSPHRRKKPG